MRLLCVVLLMAMWLPSLFSGPSFPITREFCVSDLRCVEGELAILFRASSSVVTDPTRAEESLFVYDSFTPEALVTTTVQADTPRNAIAGWSFGVAHEARFLRLNGEPSLHGTDAETSLGAAPFIQHQIVPGGYTVAVSLDTSGLATLPTGRNSLVSVSYRLIADAGTGGTSLRFSEGLAADGASFVPIELQVHGQARQPTQLRNALLRRRFDSPPELLEEFCPSVSQAEPCAEVELSISFEFFVADSIETTRSNVFECPVFELGRTRVPVVVNADIGDIAVQGWAFGIAHDQRVLSLAEDDLTITDTATETFAGGTPFDIERIVDGGFVVTQVLDLMGDSSSLPAGRSAIQRATYTVVSDPGIDGSEIRFVDGELAIEGSDPHDIAVIEESSAFAPRRLIHGLVRRSVHEFGFQLPGDCNSDATLDVSDAICIFSILFGGGGVPGAPTEFPCGDGSAAAEANIRLLDFRGDQTDAVDISNGIHLLNVLFVGAPPHILGDRCVPLSGCPSNGSCP